MEVNELRYCVGRTISTGNYESVRVDVAESARLDKSDDRDHCFHLLKEETDQRLNDIVDEVMSSLGAKPATKSGSKPAGGASRNKKSGGVRRRS